MELKVPALRSQGCQPPLCSCGEAQDSHVLYLNSGMLGRDSFIQETPSVFRSSVPGIQESGERPRPNINMYVCVCVYLHICIHAHAHTRTHIAGLFGKGSNAGKMEGSRKRGRPSIRGTDPVKEARGLSLQQLSRVVGDKTLWASLSHRVTRSQSQLNGT